MTGKKATGRTKQLSLKSKPKFHQRLKELAVKEKRLMIEVLEEALELYEQVRKERKSNKKPSKKLTEETVPQVSPEPVRSKRSRDDDEIPNNPKKEN